MTQRRYRMFLDDERSPTDGDIDMYVVRSVQDAIKCIGHYGMPYYITFDHDLGDNVPTGFDLAKWMVEQDMDDTYTLPDDFTFCVHSQNPVGKKNIEEYLGQYLKVR